MKKLHKYFLVLIVFYFLNLFYAHSQPQYYLQIYPGDNNKIIFQILPDRTYTDVSIYINFYSETNMPVKLNKKFSITNQEQKYLLKDNGVYSFVLNHNFKDIDHISLARIYEKVPIFQLQTKGTIYKIETLDDGDMSTDSSYADEVDVASSPGPLQEISLSNQSSVNDPCNTSGLLQVLHNNQIIRSSYYCDLEKDGEGKEGDFWWSVNNPTEADIVPLSGAKFFQMWNCPNCYDTINCQTISDFDRKGLLTNNSISKKSLFQGNLIAYVTRNNLYGIMRIEKLIYGRGVDLKISFKTFGHVQVKE